MGSLGHRSAVAEVFGLESSGFLAWWLWRTIYGSIIGRNSFQRKRPDALRFLRMIMDVYSGAKK